MTKKDSSFRILFPGRNITIGEHAFVVYPLGMAQVKRFGPRFAPLIDLLKKTPIDSIKGDEQQAIAKNIVTLITPFILNNMLDVIFDCVTFDGEKLKEEDVEHIPHYYLPIIIEAWISESFIGEDKLRPWIEVIERLTKEIFKKDIPIWDTLSKSLLPPVTA